jgi:hypothetical protein
VGLESAYAAIEPPQLDPACSVLPNEWDSEKHEISYFTAPLEMEPKYNFEVAFVVAFGPIEPVKGLPAIPILFSIADKVTDMVEATEAESRRIGLIT